MGGDLTKGGKAEGWKDGKTEGWKVAEPQHSS